MALKYKIGDRVRIKSLDWYNENKDDYGYVWCTEFLFTPEHSKYCGRELTISHITEFEIPSYVMESNGHDWTNEMIEGLVEEEAKSHNNMCKQLIDEMNPNVEVNVKTPKFKIGDRVITDTNMKGKIIEVVEEGWYRVDFDDYNGISQPNGVVPEENMTIMTKETKPEPKFKVGDIIISDVFTTNDDKGWKVIDVERTGYKLISVNNSGLICDIDFKNEHYYKLVEEEMLLDKAGQITDFEYEGLAYTLPDGYQFVDDNGNVINAMKIVLEKKKKEYPKTYEECCEILDCSYNVQFDRCETSYESKLHDKLLILRELLICRDAYWKIAGEEMGLGKPWEPDWKDDTTHKFIIHTIKDKIHCGVSLLKNHLLAFPTEEMRDAFYENFKELINGCKELL